MNQQRLGCISPLALISALLALLALLLIGFVSGGSMFSPGALNARPGAGLGGVSSHAATGKNCAACHPPPWSAQTMADRCQVCHTAIQAEIANDSSMHGVLLAREGQMMCTQCHTEHKGAAAAQTHYDLSRFDHEIVGYSLEGHPKRADGAAFTCGDCHLSGAADFTPQTCAECHRRMDAGTLDEHTALVGDACLDCHDGLDRFGQFDHSRTAFALAGRHQQTACRGCHVKPRAVSDFANVPADCFSCHRKDDPHQGAYGTACETCHNPSGWEDAAFDHSLSAFPLDGAHSQVACAECHLNQVYLGLASDCQSCHPGPAFHMGMFSGQECSACHTTAAWRPARYDGPHTFPINHGENANTCADCHQPNLTQWTCYACHDSGEIAREHQKEGIADFNDCLRCHPSGEKDEAEGGDDD